MKSTQIHQLINARRLSNSEEFNLFDEALQALSGSITVNDIPELCRVFCDDTQDDEAMFGIVHLLEQLRGDDYLRSIAICSPAMKDAHEWAMILNKRIINSSEYYDRYIEIIRDLESEHKQSITQLLIDVKNDNPQRFGDKIDILLEKIGC